MTLPRKPEENSPEEITPSEASQSPNSFPKWIEAISHEITNSSTMRTNLKAHLESIGESQYWRDNAAKIIADACAEKKR